MRRELGVGLAGVRIASGLIGLFAPRALHRLSGLDARSSPAALAYTRYFATRALGLGVGYLMADDATRRRLDRIGLLVDGADTAFAAAMVGRGSLPPRAAVWLMTVTASATAIDVANVRDHQSGTNDA